METSFENSDWNSAGAMFQRNKSKPPNSNVQLHICLVAKLIKRMCEHWWYMLVVVKEDNVFEMFLYVTEAAKLSLEITAFNSQQQSRHSPLTELRMYFPI